jgi:hypothetical protein
MKNLRYLVSAGLLSAVALSFMGCQARPLLGPTDGVDAQGRFDSRGKEAESRKGGKPQAVSIDYKKELAITDLSVVEDPSRTTGNGPWTFAYLITQMAGGQDPDTFVKNWLNHWMSDQTVNGDSVLARKKMKDLILDPWPRISGTDRLDLTKAPFRLLAITNRLDTRKVGNIGEGRFVFGVLDRSPNPPFGEALPFTLIFEYGITLEMGDPEYEGDDHVRGYDKEGADDRMKAVRAWAAKWHGLSKLSYGPQFNAALQQITDTFAQAGADPRKPNGSALNQLRTNEIALSLLEAFGPNGPTVPFDQIKPWEMREYHVTSSGLKAVPVALTPHLALNGSAQLANYINKNEKKILRDRHVMPADMLAGSSLVPGAFSSDASPLDPPLIWNAPGIRNPEARFKFAQNTCSGCHLIESGFEKDDTGAFIAGQAFMHVRPRLAGVESQLSPFMKGVTTKDAVTGRPRTLNDLERRIDDMQVLLGYSRTSKYYDPRTEMENPFPAKSH